MKSAAQMSMEIRAKKKAMQADPNVVDLSGIPMDKTDEDIMEQNEMTAKLGLDTNHPMSAHGELMADSHNRVHEDEEPLSDEVHMMANGGMLKGVHQGSQTAGPGRSKAGINAEGHSDTGSLVNRKAARREHRRVLSEMQDMPKPKLQGLAEGGEVDDDMKKDKMSEATVRADGGYGKVTVLDAEGGMVEDSTKKRKARLAKRMSR